MNTGRAVVFSGGGAKGGYQIGVWKALNEIGFEPDIVTGTSVGALNGALMALDKYDEAVNVWENMGMDSVFAQFVENTREDNPGRFRYIAKLTTEMLRGGADYTPLQSLVKGLMDEEALRDSPIRFGLVTTRFPNIRPVELFIDDIPKGEAADYILASAAAFPFMKSYRIGEAKYVDGAYSDNMPVSMAIHAGASEIVAVNIAKMNISKLPPSTAKIHCVEPVRPLTRNQFGSIILFNEELSRRHIRLGYLDALKEFNMLDGRIYTLEKGEKYKFGRLESVCCSLFEKLFSSMTNISRAERNGRDDVLKLLGKFSENPFEYNSSALFCGELAAEFFDISPLEIYTLDALKITLLEKAVTLLDEMSDEVSREIEGTLDSGLAREIIRGVFDRIDKHRLMAFTVSLLLKEILEPNEKRRLWLTASMDTELFCAAMFTAALLLLEKP